MKKYLFGAVLSLGIIASPALTQAAALTSSQISAIVSLLQSFGADSTTIANVKTALYGDSSGGGGGTQPWCHTFNEDLTIGSNDDDVSSLRTVLRKEGLLTRMADAPFDEDLAADAVQFQAKYGIRQTGYVGPITRAKLNALFGCSPNFPPPATCTPRPACLDATPRCLLPEPVSGWCPAIPPTTPSITVLSPNGGEVLTPGATQVVRWQSTPSGATYDVGVFPYSDSRCPGNVCTLASGISGTSYNWQAGWANMPGGIANGTYKIRVCQTGTSVCDASDDYFQIGNQQNTPSITVLSPNGGEMWEVGKSYEFKWKSHGEERIMINLDNVDTGVRYGTFDSVAGIDASTGTASWTVRNINLPIGHYKTVMTGYNTGVIDSSDAPFSIVAGTTTSATPVTLTSITPSSGPVGTSIRLDGCGSDSSSGFTLIYTGPKSGSASIPVETLGAASGCGYMTIIVPTDFPAGAYTLSVKNNQTGAMSTNSEAFTVTAPTISSINPNPATANNTTVTITGTNLSGPYSLRFYHADGITNGSFGLHFISPTSVSFIIPTGFPIGDYTVWVYSSQFGVQGVQSNVATFTVTAPAVANNPYVSLSASSIAQGGSFTGTITGAAPNAQIRIFSRGPDGVTAEDTPGTTNSSGQFSRTYTTTGWSTGSYQSWVTVNGAQSNVTTFTVIAPVVANNPFASVSPASFVASANFTSSITGAAPNATIHVFATGPDGVTSEDTPGTTNSSGAFSRTYNTTGWAAGTYHGWVTVNGVQSNVTTFTVTAPAVANNPYVSLSASSIAQGGSFTGTITGAAPNAQIRIFSRGPDGVTAEDTPGTTNSSGQFSRTYTTTGWSTGSYQSWVTVNGAQSNTVGFVITSGVSLSGGTSQMANVFNAVNGPVVGNSTSQAPATTFTYVWNNNLQIGSPYSDDITALQKALTREDVYTGEITGGFYNQTYAAVKAFQEKYGINATGYVGPLTRTQLNTLFAR